MLSCSNSLEIDGRLVDLYLDWIARRKEHVKWSRLVASIGKFSVALAARPGPGR